jgi:CHAT domain-containing protein/Tfp pilus assembly protein PilF
VSGRDLRNSLSVNSVLCFLFLVFSSITSLAQTERPHIKSTGSASLQVENQLRQAGQASSEGKFEEALQFSVRAFALADRAGNDEGRLRSLVEQGTLLWNLGRMKESSEAFARGLKVAQQIQALDEQKACSTSLEIYDLYIQGKERRDSGDYQTSIERFNKAIDLARSINGRGQELKCLRQLSFNYWELKDFQEFFALSQRALKIAQEIKHRQEEGRCLNNIGLFYWQIDDYTEALKNHESALKIARETDNQEEEDICLTNIALIYIDIGDYDRGLEYSLDALELGKKLKDPLSISKDLNNIGSILRRKGMDSERHEDFLDSLKYYSDSLKIAVQIKNQETEIKVLNNIGSVYSYLGEYAKSLSYFRSALAKAEKAQDTEELSIILNNIGIVYAHLGNFEESTRYYQRVIDLASEIQGQKVLWEAYFEIGNAYKNQNQLSAALENYQKSIAVIENIRSSITLEELKATYLGSDKRIDVYHSLIDLYIRLYEETRLPAYEAEAYRFLEKAKARAFLDSIEVSKIDLSKGISQRLLNEEAELMNRISQLDTRLLVPQLSQDQRDRINQELSGLEEQQESLRREIRELSPAYANLKYPQTLNLEQAQGILPDDETACFIYLLAREKSYGFALTRKSLKIFPLPDRKEIRGLVQEQLTTITDASNQDFGAASRLYEVLIRPGLSNGIKRLIIVPDDVLYYMPFETLTSNSGGRKWLIEDYAIAYAPSLSSLKELILREQQTGQKAPKDILAVGDPSYGDNAFESAAGGLSSQSTNVTPAESRFSRLKFSGQEIEEISRLFRPDRRDTLLRGEATEENLKRKNLADYRIIHFAAHAFIDEKKPARSAVVLSLDQDPKEDGFLQMREVFNLPLRADLVVLSACETGLGQLIRGEGIESMSRAFFYAGASSVLLSLWAVNDQATSQLLERFYLHLRAAKPIMESLRRAKLEMIDSRVLSHPYYWAGFVVSGNADAVIFRRSLKKWTLVTLSVCACLAVLLLLINKEKSSSPRSHRSSAR